MKLKGEDVKCRHSYDSLRETTNATLMTSCNSDSPLMVLELPTLSQPGTYDAASV